jgi:acetyl-CoA C-acetyltransferase
MKYNGVYILGGMRSPIGSFQGSLSGISAVEIGRQVLQGLIALTGVLPERVDECIVGSVLTAGQGQAPARQLAVRAGVPVSVPAVTVNKVCSSGLYAVMQAARAIEVGAADIVVAGGMESMSQVPYYLPKHRTGARLGHDTVLDGVIHDGLWDVYNDYHMGCAGELCAERYQLSREAQDAYALESYDRALDAVKNGLFKKEIVPVEVPSKKTAHVVSEDEEPSKLVREKVSKVPTVFKKEGTITPVNASSLNDGAAFLILCSERALRKYSLVAKARILSDGMFSREPEWFTIAPVDALKQALSSAQLDISAISAFEINEAFSSVALACISELGVPPSRVNIRGGAVALGHPIGASGARILVSLLSILEDGSGGRHGAVAICNGGGEATSLVVEHLS